MCLNADGKEEREREKEKVSFVCFSASIQVFVVVVVVVFLLSSSWNFGSFPPGIQMIYWVTGTIPKVTFRRMCLSYTNMWVPLHRVSPTWCCTGHPPHSGVDRVRFTRHYNPRTNELETLYCRSSQFHNLNHVNSTFSVSTCRKAFICNYILIFCVFNECTICLLSWVY